MGVQVPPSTLYNPWSIACDHAVAASVVTEWSLRGARLDEHRRDRFTHHGVGEVAIGQGEVGTQPHRFWCRDGLGEAVAVSGLDPSEAEPT